MAKSKLHIFESNLVTQLESVVNLLGKAKHLDFISGPEAKNIFQDILRELGLKESGKQPEAAPQKVEKK